MVKNKATFCILYEQRHLCQTEKGGGRTILTSPELMWC